MVRQTYLQEFGFEIPPPRDCRLSDFEGGWVAGGSDS